MSKDRGIYFIYFSIAFLSAISLLALYLAVRPESVYEPLTLEVTLDEGDVSLAEGLLPVTVDICSTADEQLLVSGVSTYVENVVNDDPVDRAASLSGLSAEIVFAPASCQTLGRALPLNPKMAPGEYYMNLVVSVVNSKGETQFINQRTPVFVVIP